MDKENYLPSDFLQVPKDHEQKFILFAPYFFTKSGGAGIKLFSIKKKKKKPDPHEARKLPSTLTKAILST